MQQKTPPSISGELNAYLYSGSKPRLNKVKISGGCHKVSGEIYRATLDKTWAQIHQGEFDLIKKAHVPF